jgi:NitT/TauT family transport system substrate-binding protein
MRTVIILVAAVVSVVGLLIFRNSHPLQPRHLTVSQPRILDMAPLYVAIDKGYFEKEGLRITLDDVGSPREGLDKLVSGKADIAFSADAILALKIAQKAPISILCTIDGSSHTVGLLMKKQGPPKETLAGKRVGLRLWTAPHYFLDMYLLYNLIPFEDVRLVDIEEQRLDEALLSGEVDAVTGFQADLARIRQRHPGLHVVYPEEIYRAFWVVAANDRLVEAEPETIVRFLRGLDRAVSFMLRHEAETVAIVSRHTGVTEAVIREHFPIHHFELSLDNSLLVLLEQEGDWLVERGAVQPPLPDYRKKFYLGGMKAVRPAGITVID